MNKEVIFSLPAEAVNNAKKVCVMGDFNNWNSSKEYEMTIQPDGSASIKLPLEAGKTYRYRFLVNDTVWVNDYKAEGYEPVAGYGVDNCVITIKADEKPARKTSQGAVKSTANKEASPKKKSSAPAAKAASKTVKAKSTSKSQSGHTRTGRKKGATKKTEETKA